MQLCAVTNQSFNLAPRPLAAPAPAQESDGRVMLGGAVGPEAVRAKLEEMQRAALWRGIHGALLAAQPRFAAWVSGEPGLNIHKGAIESFEPEPTSEPQPLDAPGRPPAALLRACLLRVLSHVSALRPGAPRTAALRCLPSILVAAVEHAVRRQAVRDALEHARSSLTLLGSGTTSIREAPNEAEGPVEGKTAAEPLPVKIRLVHVATVQHAFNGLRGTIVVEGDAVLLEGPLWPQALQGTPLTDQQLASTLASI